MQILRFFALLDQKRENDLLNKPEIYQYYDGNGAKLSSMYKIALLITKNFESAMQLTLFGPGKIF